MLTGKNFSEKCEIWPVRDGLRFRFRSLAWLSLVDKADQRYGRSRALWRLSNIRRHTGYRPCPSELLSVVCNVRFSSLEARYPSCSKLYDENPEAFALGVAFLYEESYAVSRRTSRRPFLVQYPTQNRSWMFLTVYLWVIMHMKLFLQPTTNQL